MKVRVLVDERGNHGAASRAALNLLVNAGIPTRTISARPTLTQQYLAHWQGNDHRLVVAVAYAFGAVYIKFIGTHAEYDAITAQAVQWSLKETGS